MSVTIDGSTSSIYWTFKLVATENGTSIANNTSNVTVEAFIGRPTTAGASYMHNAIISCPVSITGCSAQTITYRNPNRVDVAAGAWLSIGSTTFSSVPHDSDGNKTVTISANFTNNLSPSSGSASGTMKLSYIARSTACPNVSAKIKELTIININPALSSFTHSAYITFNGVNKYIQEDGSLGDDEYKFTTTTIPFTPPSSFYNLFETPSSEGTIKLTTYNGTSKIGNTSATLLIGCSINYAAPKITNMIVIDVNPASLNVTNDENNLIKYISTASCTPEYEPGDSDDPNVYIIEATINNEQYTPGESLLFPNVKTNMFSINMTNNRGMVTSTGFMNTGLFINYIPLSMSLKAYRPEPTTGEVSIDYSGNYYNGYFDSSNTKQNQLNVSYTYKEKGTTDWASLGNILVGDDLSGVELINTISNLSINDFAKSCWEAFVNNNYSMELILFEADKYGCLLQMSGNASPSSESTVAIVNCSIWGTGDDQTKYATLINMQVTKDGVAENTQSYIRSSYKFPNDTGIVSFINSDLPPYNYLKRIGQLPLTGFTIKNNSYSSKSESLGDIYDYKKQYDFRIYYRDLLSSNYYDFSITRGFPVFWWNESDIFLKGGKVISEQEIWSGTYNLTKMTTMTNMPDLSKYIGRNIRFYVSPDYGAQQIFEYKILSNSDSYNIGITHGGGSYNSDVSTTYIGAYIIVPSSASTGSIDNKTWLVHRCSGLGNIAIGSDGSISSVSIPVYIKKITII